MGGPGLPRGVPGRCPALVGDRTSCVAIALSVWRLIGFVAFEVTGDRGMLLWFPNVFELWFLLVAAVHRFRPGFRWRPGTLAVTLAVLVGLKEVHEWSLHGARLFDGISSLEFLDLVGESVRGLLGR